jgi:methionine-rich copper-binding protein CopC
MAAANWTDAQVFAQLNSGSKWAGATITYRFPTSTTGLSASGGETSTFRAPSASQQATFALAIATWDDLIAPNFQQTTLTSSNIEFAYSTTGVSYALGYYPQGGSIWFNASQSSLQAPAMGNYGFQTMIHEIGHSLGLRHMGNYDGAGSWTPSSYQDSVVLSIMSYFGPSAPNRSPDVKDADWVGTDGLTHAPETPMLNDVMAIQQLYGASTTTRLGDTVYGFSSTVTGSLAGLYDFTANPYPILTLFDSGGIDTLNLSGWNTPSDIRLESGAFSSGNSMTNNIAIAYSTVIENAVGGGGADQITGNAAANRLDGGAGSDVIAGLDGDDTLIGGLGNDKIDGGLGTDTAVLAGAFATYTVSYDAASRQITLSGAASGTDTYLNVENFQFADTTRTATQLISSDTTAPTLITTSPADNAIGVAAGANLVLNFSEPVQAGAGNLQIFNANGTLARTIAITDTTQVSFAGGTLTVNPSADLIAGSGYYVTLDASAVKDVAGNAFAGITGSTAFNFSTVASVGGDTTAPTLIASTPADNATGVAVGANLVLTFSENVQAGAGDLLILNASGTVARTIAITDATQVSFSGAALTVNPNADLAAGASYYVNLAAGVVKDMAGNAFAGITGVSALNFSTASAVVDDFPWSTATTGIVTPGSAGTSGSIEVANDGDLFKVALQAGQAYTFTVVKARNSGLPDPYLQLFDPSGNLISSDDNSAGQTIPLIGYTPSQSGTYFLGVTGQNSGFGGYTVSAKIVDTTAPTLSSSSPADNATAVTVGADIVLNFSEPIQAGTGNLVIYNAAGGAVATVSVGDANQVSISGNTLTLNPSADLALGNSYYLGMASGVVTDLAGNAYAGINNPTTLNFSTAATPADDYPMALNTTGVVTVDATGSTGNIQFVDDADLFKVQLSAGQNYLFQLTSTGLADPYLVLYDLAGDVITFNDDGPFNLDSEIEYTAPTAGTYFLGAMDFGSGLGTYRLSATKLTDDYPWSFSTTGKVTVGGATTSGAIERVGDGDLFSVALTAGTAYTFTLTSTATGGLADPYLYLYDSAGNELAFDDDGAGNFNASISYTPSASGTYFLGALDYDTGTGGYLLAGKSGTGGSLSGTSGIDILTGTAGADVISALAGNDSLTGGGGDDQLDGGAGTDIARYSGKAAEYRVSGSLAGGLTVTDNSAGRDGTDRLSGIERLGFSDGSLAFDLGATDAGGRTALMLSALLGPQAALSNPSWTGIGLSLFDSGQSMASVASLLVSSGLVAQLAGGASHAAFVPWLYKNVVGSTPSADVAAGFVALLNNGTYTQASLLTLAAELPLNQSAVNLVGLAGTGIPYL